MKAVVTPGSQLTEAGRRLDASYHTSSGVQALSFIRRWARGEKTPQPPQPGLVREVGASYSVSRLNSLAEVCEPDGIFIPGRFKRFYVNDPEHGERWLSPSDMLKADLSNLQLVSRKYTPSLENLRLHKDWILLSRSGTIGNMAYVREDMDGLIGSDDIIRVVADTNKILSGYLYTFLSSSLGKALIEQQVYGAVIQHIETHHIAPLPIPRLNTATEQRIHDLIEQGASLRVAAQKELRGLVTQLNREILSIPQNYTTRLPDEWSYSVNVVYRKGNLRLDPFHYVGHASEYKQYLKPGPQLCEIAKVTLPGQFKRMYVGSQGIPYLSGVDVYQLKVEPRLWLSPRQPELPNLVISEVGTILVQADGQRYGLLGRPVYIDETTTGAAFSNHLVRINCHELDIAGYVYLFLSTEAGRRELLRQSYGTSIPTIPVKAFEGLRISGAETEMAHLIGHQAVVSLGKRTQANALEDKAQALLAAALGLPGGVSVPVRRESVEVEV